MTGASIYLSLQFPFSSFSSQDASSSKAPLSLLLHLCWQNPGVDFGDVSERLALRKRLQCRSFRWYLEHVYPEMRIYNNTITYGEVRHELLRVFFPYFHSVVIQCCGLRFKRMLERVPCKGSWDLFCNWIHTESYHRLRIRINSDELHVSHSQWL